MVDLLSLPAWPVWMLALALLPGCAIYRAEEQRQAVDWIESQGGRVEYDYQRENLKPVDVWYNTGSEEDEEQWQSRLPEDTWVAKKFGREYAYRVHNVSFYQSKLAGDVSRITGARGLKQLDFGECELTEELLAAIGDCRDLEQLTLSDCQLQNAESLAQLAKLPKLKELSITYMSLEGNSLAHIGRCRNLKLLELTFCEFDAAQVQHLRGLTQLRNCCLGGTSVGDEQLGVLRSWPQLKRLVLGAQVTDAGLSEVGSLRNLEDVAFLKSNVTDAGMEHIIGLPKLRSLQISGCQVSTEMWQRIAREHPGLGGGYVR